MSNKIQKTETTYSQDRETNLTQRVRDLEAFVVTLTDNAENYYVWLEIMQLAKSYLLRNTYLLMSLIESRIKRELENCSGETTQTKLSKIIKDLGLKFAIQ